MSLDTTTAAVLALPRDTGGVMYEVPADTPADGVWVWEIDGAKWRIQPDGPYRAAWAVTGDGDQTSILQAVFNDSEVSEVVFDNGDVLISGTITVPPGKYVSFFGNGRVIGGGTGIINGGRFRWLKPNYYSDITINPETVYSSGGSASFYTGILLDAIEPFNPDTLSGQFVYQADNPGDIVVSGSDVTSWAEKLGSGKSLFGFNSPQYFTAGGANNKPYIKLVGSSYLEQTGAGRALTTTPADVFVVMRTPSISTSRLFSVAANSGANGPMYTSPLSERGAYVYTGIPPFYLGETFGYVPRTTWMVLRVKWTDEDSLSIEINDEAYNIGPFVQNGASTAAYALAFLQLAYPDSEISEIRLFNNILSNTDANNVKQHLMVKYGIQRPSKRMIVCGDSHTVGLQSGASIGTPYFEKLTTDTTYILNRYAANGSCAVNDNTPFDFVDFSELLHPFGDNQYYVIVNYGTNDSATASSGYGWTSWPQWKADYKARIQGLITAGFSPSRIIMVTPPYSTAGYVSGNLGTIRTIINEISTELSTAFVDWYTLMQAAGLDAGTIPGGDGIHVNDASHLLVYNAIVAITGT